MEHKQVAGLLALGLLVILVVSFVSKANPTGEVVSKPVPVCKTGETKDLNQVKGDLGIKLFEYSLCTQDGAWTGPHVSTSKPS